MYWYIADIQIPGYHLYPLKSNYASRVAGYGYVCVYTVETIID